MPSIIIRTLLFLGHELRNVDLSISRFEDF